MKQNFSFLTEDQKRKAVDNIISYFLDERGEEIGIIAAENLLDFMTEKLGKPIYNKAILDTKKLVGEHLSNLQIDIDALTELEK